MLREYGVFCPQVRDLYSAGPMKGMGKAELMVRGCSTNAIEAELNEMSEEVREKVANGRIPRTARIPRNLVWSLIEITKDMEEAAEEMSEETLGRYWQGEQKMETRIQEWLRRADEAARYWKPSEVLLLNT